MRYRCSAATSPDFPRYGGRGITVDPRWDDFEVFLENMGKRPNGATLDRIDNEGPYSPENCRWATGREQQRNRRQNRRITIDGETLTLIEWCERTGIGYSTARERIGRGWSPKRTFTEPIHVEKRSRRVGH